jgi:hypothetical protein
VNEAELYRLKGELLLAREGWREKDKEAEECFLKAIEIAQKQQLGFYQFQAALGSCKLLVCLVSPFLTYSRGVTPESASAAKVLA